MGANKHVMNMKGQTNMFSNKKVVSKEDKCRFGSSVHNSMRLECGRHTDSCMNMQASVQRCKEAKKVKRVAQSKQGKHINIIQSGEKGVSSTPTPGRCISQVVTSKQALGGTKVTTQASGPKDRQAQANGGNKAWQSLDLDKQTWIYNIEASK